jgi:hypothetical protein
MPLWLFMNIKTNISILLLFVFLISVASCKKAGKKQKFIAAAEIDSVVRRMTDIMVHDVTNPPLAARFFAYSLLSGYEIVSQNDTAVKNMNGILNEYPSITKPSLTHFDYQLAALLAVIETASRIQPSGKLLQPLKEKILKQAKQSLDYEEVEGSMQYAEDITGQVLKYAREDGYRKFSDYPRYTTLEGEGHWFPTPPGYIAAIEPYFGNLRTFLLDSGARFNPRSPTPFNKNKSSGFFKLMDTVYQKGIHLTNEEKEIAAFWDCNPFALEDQGHLKVGLKKISPGAHWLGIAGIACAQQRLSFDSSMEVHALLAITLTDAFVSCWKEKFKTNRIRPETAIRLYIDPQWKPFLQTPPFPEYLSGHSVVSGASSVILSHYFGEKFTYKDTVEQEFGLTPRSFQSFRQAAAEAAVSRFYGGIHFLDANINGLKQGEIIGEYVLLKYYKR